MIAPLLGDRLGLRFFDRLLRGPDLPSADRIMEQLSEEERSELPVGRLVSSLAHMSSAFGFPTPRQADLQPHEELRRRVEANVERIAMTSGGVILGRASAVVLAKCPFAFHVRLDGPPHKRVAQGMALEQVAEEVSRSHQIDADRARSRFVSRLFDRDSADPSLYHLALDSTAIPYANSVDVIALAASAFWKQSGISPD